MAKPAKRPEVHATRNTLTRLRSLPGRAAAATTAELWDGHVTGVEPDGGVRAVLAGGKTIDAARPGHVDAAWLAAAARRAPVPAAFAVTRPSGRYVLWAIFPTAVHADVRVDVVIRGREVRVEADAVHLGARDALLRLDADGNVSLRGRDVTSHARRVNRIKGGAIRLN